MENETVPDLTEEEREKRDRIIAALADLEHNATGIAARLGLSRRALIAKLKRYGIPRPPPSESTRLLIEKYGMPRTPLPERTK